jgi:polysaccharide export outer membrane protein
MGVLRFSILLFALLLSGCAVAPKSKSVGAQHDAPITNAASYLLDTGDVLRITVYNDAQLTNSYGIDDAGYISMPLVGRIAVRGRTVSQTAAVVTARLAEGYLRDPNVAVEVIQYRPFYIQGEVKNAGQFPFVFGMTVRAAVSTAGGFSEVASEATATIYRKSGGTTRAIRVTMDAPIQPGDTIVVHERWL